MKRIVLIITSLILIFTLAACGGKVSDGAVTDSKVTEQESGKNSGSAADTSAETGGAVSNDSSVTAENNTDASGEKVLVIYFSASGNTKRAAELIAAETGGDLYEITPTEPYSEADLNWRDGESRVSREHDNPEERKVALASSAVENFGEYGTVYIGYPIWWGVAAWPVSSFVELNNFNGKTVIPFCTSSSSGLGDSGKLLEQAANSGTWLEGHRFSSNSSASDVKAWIDSMK